MSRHKAVSAKRTADVVQLQPKAASGQPMTTRQLVELIPYKDWHRVNQESAPVQGMRRDISTEDIRDTIVGIVHETYGRTEAAYEMVASKYGCSAQTLKAWASGKVKSPQLNKIRSVLLACGKRDLNDMLREMLQLI